jgi:hypothetical protein
MRNSVSKPKSQKSTLTSRKKAAKRINDFDFKKYLIELKILISRYYPDLIEIFNQAPDPRLFYVYQPKELIAGCICMFLFRQKSRNAMNQNSQQSNIQCNIANLFGISLAHFDTITKFFKTLPPEFLEAVNTKMLQILIARKTLDKYRLDSNYHLISIDGVCVNTSDTSPFENCPHREKNDNKIYLTWILEAKLVCNNGFCFSFASELIENQTGFVKQDCEKMAFYRLCNKIRLMFPKLPICLVCDGLFVGEPSIKICEKLNFRYIFTLKDGNMSSLHTSFAIRQQIEKYNLYYSNSANKNEIKHKEYFFSNRIKYNKHELNMFQLIETKTLKNKQEIEHAKFLYVTDLKITLNNIEKMREYGRLRWKIENEGFNTQKNLGYNLKHKFCRKNKCAILNYYFCLQIAHTIEQLLVKSNVGKKIIDNYSLMWIWRQIFGYLMAIELDVSIFNNASAGRKQYKY